METTLLLTMYGGLGMIALAVALFKWNELRKKKAEHWKPTEMDQPTAEKPVEPEPISAGGMGTLMQKENVLDELGLPAKDAIPAVQPSAPVEEEGLFATKAQSEPEAQPESKQPVYKKKPRTHICENCGEKFLTNKGLSNHIRKHKKTEVLKDASKVRKVATGRPRLEDSSGLHEGRNQGHD